MVLLFNEVDITFAASGAFFQSLARYPTVNSSVPVRLSIFCRASCAESTHPGFGLSW